MLEIHSGIKNQGGIVNEKKVINFSVNGCNGI